MLIHQYDRQTGQYVSSWLADPDPINPTRWLIPSCCTDVPLPQRQRNQWPFFRDGAWVLLPDFRGQRLFRKVNGAAAEILAPGITADDAGLTPIPCPGDEYVWADDGWQIDPRIVAQRERDAAMREFDRRMSEAQAANAGKADAYAAGLLSDEQVALFKAWSHYQMELVRAVNAADFPAHVQWPAPPDEQAIVTKALSERVLSQVHEQKAHRASRYAVPHAAVQHADDASLDDEPVPELDTDTASTPDISDSE
ncbi:tail fiber assembly protein [Mycetohabitans rhizoxinica]|uniref:tail fiber assembly protein n=1 Tax=Mycetohabitans rhizoxinica TaxID=412963 RepID=UPI0030D4E67D